MLKYRLIFGPIMIIALLVLIYFDAKIGPIELPYCAGYKLPAGILLFAIFLLVIVLGSGELVAIFKAKGVEVHHSIMMLAGVAAFVAMYLGAGSQQSIGTVLTPLVAVFVIALLRHVWKKKTDGAAQVGAAAAFAYIYMGAMPGFFLLIRQDFSPWVIAVVILVTKNGDTGAFTAGKLFGKHKLIPFLSPGKTWEGLAGAVFLSTLTAVLLAWASNANEWAIVSSSWDSVSVASISGVMVPLHIPLWYAGLCGAILALLGHGGDLLASLLKRDAGIKDSGNAVPGFGGIIDVCDSPIFIAPFAYWLLLGIP
jgi:phosphatidate cytidylyltransferase